MKPSLTFTESISHEADSDTLFKDLSITLHTKKTNHAERANVASLPSIDSKDANLSS
jgi:hypothetical protein